MKSLPTHPQSEKLTTSLYMLLSLKLLKFAVSHNNNNNIIKIKNTFEFKLLLEYEK